jgi:hypothetical protein
MKNAEVSSVVLRRETRLVAEMLYHGLTTGAGVQTLGEEYCDILQVAGKPAGQLHSGQNVRSGGVFCACNQDNMHAAMSCCP